MTERNLWSDAASLDLQLPLPGVDHVQAVCQLSLQFSDVTQLSPDVVMKTLFRQAHFPRFKLHINTCTNAPLYA